MLTEQFKTQQLLCSELYLISIVKCENGGPLISVVMLLFFRAQAPVRILK